MKYFRRILTMMLILSLIPFTVSAEETVISADDENIKYIGRWVKNEKGAMEGSFECSLILRFTGTSITLEKGSSGKMHYRIDGGEYKQFSSRKLAQKLSEGEHTLEIYSYAQHGFPKIAGFLLDAGATLLPVEDKPVIEFIGDSILEGYVVGSNSVLNSYGHRTAERMGFYRNIVAFGGITVCPNYGNPDKQGMINRYKMLKEYSEAEPVSENWDTSKFVPDYIVINLGTNDGNPSVSEFRFWYTSFLDYLRTTYKDAKIFVMTPFNGRRNADILAVYEIVKDENMFLIDSYKWNIPGGSDNLHPDVEGHDMAAEKLEKAITEILSRTPAPEVTEAPEVTPAPQKTEKTGSWVLPVVIGIVAIIAVAVALILVIKNKMK